MVEAYSPEETKVAVGTGMVAPGGTPLADASKGLVEAGNIDMATRPRVKNPDGSVSTVRSIGVKTDKGEAVIPTVSDDGRIMTNDEAVAQFKTTGKHLGIYNSEDAASAGAQATHEAEAARITQLGPTAPAATTPDDASKDFAWGVQRGAEFHAAPGVAPPPEFFTKSMDARAQGMSWKDIHAAWDARIQEARDAGMNDKDIQTALGFSPDAKGFERGMSYIVRQQLGAQLKRSVAEEAGVGFRSESTSGAVEGNVPAEVEDPGSPEDILHTVARSAGKEAGDLAYQVLGGILGAPAGPAGSFAGAMAMPVAIREEAVDAWLHGRYKGGTDFARRQVNIAADVIEAAEEGAAMEAGGAAAESVVAKGTLKKLGAQAAGRAVALQGVTTIISGKLPTYESIVDTGVQVASMYAMDYGAVQRLAPRIANNAMKYYGRTGMSMADIVAKAKADPGFAKILMVDDTAGHVTPVASATVDTKSADGPMTLDRSEKPDALAVIPSPGHGLYGSHFLSDPKGVASGAKMGRPDLHPDVVHWLDEASKALPEGYTARLRAGPGNHTEGTYTGGAVSQVTLGMAADIEIVDPQGHVIEPYALREHRSVEESMKDPVYRLYKQLGDAYIKASDGQGRWGGNYGQPDLMQFGTIGRGYGAGANAADAGRTWVPGKVGPETVPMKAGSTFDDGLAFIQRAEGRYTHDSGGDTAYGISSHAYPDEFANGKRPSKERAAQIFKETWNRMEIEKLPADMRLTVFDAAVNEGEGKTKEMLAASGGDKATFVRLRKAHYDKLIAENPAKYGQYQHSWYQRLSDSSNNVIPIDNGTNPSGTDHPVYGAGPTQPEAHADVEEQVKAEQEKTWAEINHQDLEDRVNELDHQLSNIHNSDNAGDFVKLRYALSVATTDNATPERALEAMQVARDMGRRDITQVILDKAANRVPPAPVQGEGNPAAFIELQKIHEEKQKEVDQLAKLAGQDPRPAKERTQPKLFEPLTAADIAPAPAPVEEGQPAPAPAPVKAWKPISAEHVANLAHPLVKNARTGNPVIDGILQHPTIADVVANAEIDNRWDAPWTASGSKPESNRVTYIGNHVPDALVVEGDEPIEKRTFSTAAALIVHENIEEAIMDRLLAAGWDKQRAYMYAHQEGGEKVEHAIYAWLGIDPAKAEKAWLPVIKAGLESKGTNYPPDAYRETGQFDNDSHGLHNLNEPMPTAEEIAEAERVLTESINKEQQEAYTASINGAFAKRHLPVEGTEGPPNPQRIKQRERRAQGQAVVTSLNPYRSGMSPREIMLSHLDDAIDPALNDPKTVRMHLAELYTDFFKEDHPIVQVAQAQRNQSGGRILEHALDPEFMSIWARSLPNTVMLHYFERAENGGMGALQFERDGQGKLTYRMKPVGSKSLQDIYKDLNPDQLRDLHSLSVANFILNAHELGRVTWDHDIEFARMEKARLSMPEDPAQRVFPGWPAIWAALGRKMPNVITPSIHGPETLELDALRKNGPHYRSSGNTIGRIIMFDPTEVSYEQNYGPGGSFQATLDHEMGHAVAHALGKLEGMLPALDAQGNWLVDANGDLIGLNPVEHSELMDELVLANFAFRPGIMNVAESRGFSQDYWHTPAELMADATAHYITHPEYRYLMPKTASILGPDFARMAPHLTLEQVGNPIWRAWRSQVDLRNSTLKMMRDGGFMDFDNFRELIAREYASVPGYRSAAELAERAELQNQLPPGGGMGGRGSDRAVSYNSIGRAHGSELSLARIDQGLAKDVMIRTKAAIDNMANQPLVDAMGQLGWAEMLERRPVRISGEDLNRLSNMKTSNEDGEEEAPAIWRLVNATPTPGTIPVFRDGHLEVWRVRPEHRNVVQALRNFDNRAKNLVIKLLTTGGDALRTGIISNPGFLVRNTIFDMLLTPMSKDATLRDTIEMFHRGLGPIIAHYTSLGEERWMQVHNDLFNEWNTTAGPIHAFGKQVDRAYILDMIRSNQRIEEGVQNPDGSWTLPGAPHGLWGLTLSAWNTIKSPFRFMQAATRAASQIMPVGRYIKDVTEGKSSIEAQVRSNQQVFHTVGSGRLLNQWRLNRLQPFISVVPKMLDYTFRGMFGQGPRMLARAISKMPLGADLLEKAGFGRGGEGFENTRLGTPVLATKWWGHLALLHTIPMLATWFLYKDEDWYKDQNPHTTLTSLLQFKVGEHVYRVPGIPGVSLIAGGMVIAALDKLYRKEPHHFHLGAEFLKEFLPQYPMLGSSVMTPFWETHNNYSEFRDAPVTSAAEEAKLPEFQFGPNTSELAKALGPTIGVTPNNLDYVIQNSANILGTGDRAIETALRAMGLAKPKPLGEDAGHMPWISSWVSQDVRKNRPYEITNYNEVMKKASEVRVTITDALKTGNQEEFDEVVKRHPGMVAAHAWNFTNSALQEMAAHKDKSKAMLATLREMGRSLTPEQKDAFKTLEKATAFIRQAQIKTSIIYNGDLGMSPEERLGLLSGQYNEMRNWANIGLPMMDKLKWR